MKNKAPFKKLEHLAKNREQLLEEAERYEENPNNLM
jgi:hypothetical protein